VHRYRRRTAILRAGIVAFAPVLLQRKAKRLRWSMPAKEASNFTVYSGRPTIVRTFTYCSSRFLDVLILTAGKILCRRLLFVPVPTFPKLSPSYNSSGSIWHMPMVCCTVREHYFWLTPSWCAGVMVPVRGKCLSRRYLACCQGVYRQPVGTAGLHYIAFGIGLIGRNANRSWALD